MANTTGAMNMASIIHITIGRVINLIQTINLMRMTKTQSTQ